MNRTGDTAQQAGGRRPGEGARRRAVLELVARYESALKRTARRFSLDAGDAEDAYQRALEIVLTKAPTTEPQELIRWTQTVVKHEALAVRRGRERLLGRQPREAPDGTALDPLALIPAAGEGPDEQVARREEIARSREALRRLKPAELRALALLAEGYSYVEIGEITGFSQTKVNRVLAEGRSRFRNLIASSEDGSRCRELRPLLSAFCDGEATAADATIVREHLRACGHCRATMRAYRAAPGLAGALVPALLPAGTLLGRLRDLLARGASKVAGTSKLVTACAVGAAGCVAVGAVPVPFTHQTPPPPPAVVRSIEPSHGVAETKPQDEPGSQTARKARKRRSSRHAKSADAPVPTAPAEATPEPIEYEPPPPAEPVATPPPPESSGSPAGEFGP